MIMPYIRAAALIIALLGFYLIGVPVQRLARRQHWALAQKIPVFFCQTICFLLGLRIRYSGPLTAAKPRMLVANHMSWTDILVLAARETPSFVAKAEVAHWPILGAFARVQDTIFVQRESRADIPRVNGAMAEHMHQGKDIVLFAEGTSSDGGEVLSFKPSHFGAARDLLKLYPETPYVTIQPVALAFTAIRGVKLTDAQRRELAWYGDEALAPHLWRLLKAAPVECMVSYGTPLAMDTSADRKILAKETENGVREALARALAV